MRDAATDAALGWLYFGCGREAGHYLFDRRGSRLHQHPLNRFDGRLCGPERDGLYIAVLSRLGGHGYSALAWWDRTVDKRPGSNSIIFAPSLTCSAESIVEGMKLNFPWVAGRLPQPLKLPKDHQQ